jgi:Rps23 Pro-64 3,4-dihydroxylase Tpa1-like proline 4-hydroxylase
MENNNFLTEGAFIGNIIDFITESEFNDVKNYASNLKKYIEPRRKDYLECIFTLKNDYEKYDNVRNVPYDNVDSTEIFMKENGLESWQKWYMLKNPWEFKQTYGEILDNISLKIVNHLYPKKNYNKNDFEYSGTFTLYEQGHYIENHRDGKNESKLCNILIYLNEEHNEGDGGELELNTYTNKKLTIKPLLGNFAVLDFTTGLGVEHSVNMVNGDYKRFTYLNGYSLAEKPINLL